MTPSSFSPPVLLAIYRKALLIKLVDERIRSPVFSDRMPPVYCSPRGQEIIAAAMALNLTDDDYIVTIYRGLHDQLAKGMPLRQLFAEYLGKATGACKGKGGPLHISYPQKGIMVTTGIVGAGLPIANGLALASQVKGDGRVTVCNFGDGASNIGAFHESLNMASLWKLPVIFLCQNNQWSECTSYVKATTVANISERANSYNMRGITINGNDPQEMYEASREAVGRARKGEGPTLLEAKTFRLMGHYASDPGTYIPAEQYSSALAPDPIPLVRAAVLASRVATEAELQCLVKEITADIDDAQRFALQSPMPDVSEINTDIYASEAST